MGLKTLSQNICYEGSVGIYRHNAAETACSMKFSVFIPPQAQEGPVPVLTFLAGLTCSEETFMVKAGAQRLAAKLGLMLVAPDTSPRGEEVPDDPNGDWDFGLAAGFYLDATQKPWATNYRMYSYITKELPAIIAEEFPADMNRQGIFGHSMGGHGALTIALKNPTQYKSVSAFAPISAPMRCPWGDKAFSNYLGEDRTVWRGYDASELMLELKDVGERAPILIDQGKDDPFLADQLHPGQLELACKEVGYPITCRYHAGYDHGYYFISTFIDDHLKHHAEFLGI